jgi:hypothetical protein
MRFVDAIRRFWQDRIRGPVLRRYGDAVEELGGVPWRTFSGTERWFLNDTGPERKDRPPTLDTHSLKIMKPTLVDRLREHPKAAWASGAVLGLLLLAVVFRAFSGGSAQAAPAHARAVAPAPAAAPVAAPVVVPAPAPIVVTPTTTPAHTQARAATKIARTNVSPSVRALFEGKGGGGSKAVKSKPQKRAGKKGKRR